MLLKSVTGFAGSGLGAGSGFERETDGIGDLGVSVASALFARSGFDLSELGMGELRGFIERGLSRTSGLGGAISGVCLVELSEGVLPR